MMCRIAFNKEQTGPNYVGEAEFVTAAEWEKELQVSCLGIVLWVLLFHFWVMVSWIWGFGLR